MAHLTVHKPQPFVRRMRLLRFPNLEPSQRHSGALPQDLADLPHRWTSAGRRGLHSYGGFGIGESRAQSEPGHIARGAGLRFWGEHPMVDSEAGRYQWVAENQLQRESEHLPEYARLAHRREQAPSKSKLIQ